MKDEDKKLILDWCGLKETRKWGGWYDPSLPEGEPRGVLAKNDPVDLNFYLDYAVPRLLNVTTQSKHKDRDVHIFLRYCEGQGSFKKGWLCSLKGYQFISNVEGIADPEEAFGEALLKLIKNNGVSQETP